MRQGDYRLTPFCPSVRISRLTGRDRTKTQLAIISEDVMGMDLAHHGGVTTASHTLVFTEINMVHTVC